MLREALTASRLRAMPPDEAAALWISRRAEGLTSQEANLLGSWLASDPDHRGAFDRADRAWQSLDGADDHEILSAFRRHALSGPGTAPRGIRDWARVAAMILLIATAALLATTEFGPWFGVQPASPGRPSPGLVYASAKGEVRDVTLADGSRMTLDTDTVARGFTGGARGVRLERGRIFLAVRHDPDRPFFVDADNRRVAAIGTKFDVRLDSGGLVVRLFEGKVAIEPTNVKAPPVVLRPAQAFVERNGTATVRTVDGLGDALNWRKGLAVFDNATLAEAAVEMNRYSTRQIVVRNPSVAMMHISGQFRTGDPERFARTLAEVQPVRMVRRSNREIEIVPAR